MKNLSKILSMLLVILITVQSLPLSSLAISGTGNEFSIKNSYMTFKYNATTGGFGIETIDGHPQKAYDNNIPLLYKDDDDFSNGTSFLTVRIDGKDYVFGQDYEWFGIKGVTSAPEISEDGSVMSIDWNIKNYTITLRAALSLIENQDTTGNIGLSVRVKNGNEKSGTVGIRMLLDNALSSVIDAPNVVVDSAYNATIVETEYSVAKGNMVQQLAYTDSLASPQKMAYALINGFSNLEETKPDKIIVGHWANLANTRYDYEPDKNCNFSNYSNKYRTNDTATAFYWSEDTVAPGAERYTELLYGIGNFTKSTAADIFNVNMTVGEVKLDSAGTDYTVTNVNGTNVKGVFEVTVELDNSLNYTTEKGVAVKSLPLRNANLILSVQEGLSIYGYINAGGGFTLANEGDREAERVANNDVDGYVEKEKSDTGEPYYILDAGKRKTFIFYVKADKLETISSKRIYVAVSAVAEKEDGTLENVAYAADRYILVPGTSKKPVVAINSISPKNVYYSGSKNITLSGDLAALEALWGERDGWDLYFTATASGTEYKVDKNKIALLYEGTDENKKVRAMSLSTDTELPVGTYDVVFKFTDVSLRQSFGASMKASVTLNSSNDPKYKCLSYGIVAMVRYSASDIGGTSGKTSAYEIVAFDSEEDLNTFMKDGSTVTGLKKTFTYDPDDDEVLATVRGNIMQMKNPNGDIYYSASTNDGEVTINNVLCYTGEEPLVIEATYTNDGARVQKTKIKGDGLLSVIGSIAVWKFSWSIEAALGTKFSLCDDDAQKLKVTLGGAGHMIQNIIGFAFDLKFGELYSEKYGDDENGGIIYGIGFGGKLNIPFDLFGKKKEAGSAAGGSAGGSATTSAAAAEAPIATPVLAEVEETAEPTESAETTEQTEPTEQVEPTEQAEPTEQVELAETEETVEEVSSETEEATSNDIVTLAENTPSAGSSSGGSSGGSSSGGGAAASTATQSKWVKKSVDEIEGDDYEDETEYGGLTVDIEDLKYGQSAEMDGEEYDIKIGFIGIAITVEIMLPDSVVGKLIKTASGESGGSITVNTIDGIYGIDFKVALKSMEFGGGLTLKVIKLKGKNVPMLDRFKAEYNNNLVGLPIFPPTLYLTGGSFEIEGLADIIAEGNVDNLRLEVAINLLIASILKGTLTGEFSATGFSLVGEATLAKSLTPSALKAEIGVAIRWADPWSGKVYGACTFAGGLLKGSISVTFAYKYFMGYGCFAFMLPESIPFIGGMTLAQVEAAIGTEYVGAALTLLKLKYGFIYYWSGDFTHGFDIDILNGGRAGEVDGTWYEAGTYIDENGVEQNSLIFCGTNMSSIKSTTVSNGGRAGTYWIENFDATTSDSLLLTLELVNEDGNFNMDNFADLEALQTNLADKVTLTPPEGDAVPMVYGDESGNGNFRIQDMRAFDNGKIYMFISVTDEELLKSGEWRVDENLEGLKIVGFGSTAVSNLPELESATYTYSESDPMKLTANWTTDCDSDVSGTMNFYLTTDSEIVEKMRAMPDDVSMGGNTEGLSLGIQIGTDSLDDIKDGSSEITLPEHLENGTYYLVAALEQNNAGVSVVETSESFTFINPNLPEALNDAWLIYGGNNLLSVGVDFTGNEDTFDTLYICLYDEDDNLIGTTYYSVADGLEGIKIGKNLIEGDNSLTAGKKYYATITTAKDCGEGLYAYGGILTTESYTYDDILAPSLVKVEHNLALTENDGTFYSSNSTPVITYTFNKEVAFRATIDGEFYTAYSADGSDYSTVWSYTPQLNEGVRSISFKAKDKYGNEIKGEDYIKVDEESEEVTELVKDAIITFTLDTLNPILTFTRSKGEGINDNGSVAISNQTVYADADGNFTANGLTDPEVKISLSPSDEISVSVDKVGAFTVNGKIGKTESYREFLVTAEDFAGNKSQANLYVINPEITVFEKLILLNGDDSFDIGSESDELHLTGYNYIELGVGASVDVGIFGETKNGTRIKLSPDDITWNVLYETNCISIEDGRITANSSGETAIRLSSVYSVFENDDGSNVETGVSDIIVIKIVDNGYRYSLLKNEQFTLLELYAIGNLGKVTVTFDGITNTLLYDDERKSYKGAFIGAIDTNAILQGFSNAEAENAPTLFEGDAINDNALTKEDVEKTVDICLGMPNDANDANVYVRADVNKDGVVNVIDAQLILTMMTARSTRSRG